MRTRERMRKCLKVPVVEGNEKWDGSRSGYIWILVRDRGDRDSFFFWKCRFLLKSIFPFPPSPAKLIGDYFYNRQCGANRSIAIIMRQYIGTPNHQCEWAMQPEPKNLWVLKYVIMSCKFGPHRLLTQGASFSLFCVFSAIIQIVPVFPVVSAFLEFRLKSFQLSGCSGHCKDTGKPTEQFAICGRIWIIY